MLREPTMEKLQTMRLGVMAAAWSEQQRSADVIALSFDERFAMIVDAEWMARENKRLDRALKEAKLRIAEASVEGIDYPPRRELDKASVRHLGTCSWVEEHQVVIVTGATGTGKTYVSCALAQQACRKGYRAMYRRAPRLRAWAPWRQRRHRRQAPAGHRDGRTSSCRSPAWSRPP